MKILAAVLLIAGFVGCYGGHGGGVYSGDYDPDVPHTVRYSQINDQGQLSFGTVRVNPSGYYWGYDTKKGRTSGYIHIDPGE